MTAWLNQLIIDFSEWWPAGSFLSYPNHIRGLLAVVFVCFVCGAVGSLVVANRMAFFSDALAHSAFAGVALGLLYALIRGVEDESFRHSITFIMIVFGIVVGLLIAWVREATNLASDTVIGVFFAGSIGVAAMLTTAMSGRRFFHLESFIFGDPLFATAEDLVQLIALAIITAVFLFLFFNAMVFASFNQSLALSRRLPVRFCHYAFIVLLAVIVNVCIRTVGALLINALLIVPAATAAKISGNMRQLFRWSIGLCLLEGVGGILLSWELRIPDPATGRPIQFGDAGTIVVLSVVVFFAALFPWRRIFVSRRSPLHQPTRNETMNS